jgi:hypothetical protein
MLKSAPGREMSLQVKLPVPVRKLPVHRDIFPVISLRELSEKSLQHNGFLLRN